MTAASQGHTEVMAALVKKGVPVNDVAASGGTALMFAAVGGHNDSVDSPSERGGCNTPGASHT